MFNSAKKEKLVSYLQSGLSQFWKTLHKDNIEQLACNWLTEIQNKHNPLPLSKKSESKTSASESNMSGSSSLTKDLSETEILMHGFLLLSKRLENTEKRISDLRNRHRIFLKEMAQATLLRDQHNLILEFCSYLGGSKQGPDKHALKRWMDESAVSERWNSRVKDQEYYAAFLMRRMAAIFDLIAFAEHDFTLPELWQELTIESHLGHWIRYGFEVKVQLAAFHSISSILKIAHSDDSHLLSSELLRYTYRFALDSKQDPELQVEALQLLAVADINKAKSLIDKRLARDNDEQQIFFREAISEIICLHYLNKPDLINLTNELVNDPSPLVRQRVIQTLAISEDDHQIAHIVDILAHDPSDAVFCQLATQIPYLLHWSGMQAFYINGLNNKQSYLRLRALCTGLLGWLSTIGSKNSHLPSIISACEQALLALNQTHDSPKVQHLAMETREKIWAAGQPQLSKILTPILQHHGKNTYSTNTEQQVALSTDEGKRWLAANIGHQFSMQLHKKAVFKGDNLGFRFWRFIFELAHPATDKRQHHSHITGRLYKGKAFIPSATLAEVSQTTVPGEPLHHSQEGHWRPFLPLVDQFIAALDDIISSEPVVLHHVCGQTIIEPPKTVLGKVKARIKLTVRFSHYAKMRNVAFSSANPGQYIAAMRKLGFKIQQSHYPLLSDERRLTPATPAVARFFELALPLSVIQFYQDFQRYFVSVYQNTINHILVFSIAMVMLFWGSHIATSRRFKQARNQIPMTIGGWGTRGKSGTERLKAALVNALGLSTFSKTTGCEAMFLYATRYGDLKEMFLFRPYDKATIWEQTFVVRLAAKLKSDVLCWECMGLTPRYIDILQQQWMKDDFITITNCFPDHEDLQGPAGIDVPQVIAKFIAPRSKVWTSEENMLAYLQQEAAIKQANLTHVDWLDIATIPEDLLSRFPYEEHPANIALVAKMANEMQITRTMAIKEMADRVVPDIGVLQVFPRSQVHQRQMRFINGMSANERYGALANWQRLKYDDPDGQQKGQYLLVTVINNRADRVPRSKVFARLIAYDFSATRHFIVGNNLSGFHAFAMEAWRERMQSDFNNKMSGSEFNQQFQKTLQFLLIPDSEAQLLQRINQSGLALSSLAELQELHNAEKQHALKQHGSATVKNETHSSVENNQQDNNSLDFWLAQMQLYLDSNAGFLSDGDNGQIPAEHLQKAIAYLTRAFSEKIVLIDDFYITGEQLNQEIAMQLPQRINIDILGLQNIKGPGLDMVYCWQQWKIIHDLLALIASSYGDEIESYLTELAGMPHFSCLDMSAMIEFIDKTQNVEDLHSESAILHLNNIKNTLEQSNKEQNVQQPGSRYLKPLIEAVEEVLDIFDAVKRGRKAKRVLVDLANQRISLNKAALLLKEINKRQKGGWLLQK